MRQDLYLHFMNRDARDILGITDRLSVGAHMKLLDRALNASVMLCEQRTVMPPGFFLECPLAYDVLSKKTKLIRDGLIILPRREPSLEHLIEKKRSEYGSVRDKFEGLFDDNKIQLLVETTPYFIRRETEIGKSATAKWEDGPDLSESWNDLKNGLSARAIENARSAPRILLENGEALTWAALRPHLTKEVLASEPRIRVYLQRNYFTLYIDEFDLVVLRDIPHFVDLFALPSPGVQYSFRLLAKCMDLMGVPWVLDLDPECLARLKFLPAFVRFIDCYVQLAAFAGTETNFHVLLGQAISGRGYKDGLQHLDIRILPRRGSLSISEEVKLLERFDLVASYLESRYSFYHRESSSDAIGPQIANSFVPWKNPLASRQPRPNTLRVTSRMKTVFIATANKRETSAVLQHFNSTLPDGKKALPNTESAFLPRYEFEFGTQNGAVRVAIAQADETGGDEAADLLQRIVDEVHPDAIFYVGCAALLDEKQKPVENSVFLARTGIDSDKMELADGNAHYSMEQHPGDLLIIRVLIQFDAAGEFAPINFVTNRDFISGSAFLRDRTAQKRKDLVNKYPRDAVVLEMEAFAIYKAVYKMRARTGLAPNVVVIKGISDYGDESAQDEKDKKQRAATVNALKVVEKYLYLAAG